MCNDCQRVWMFTVFRFVDIPRGNVMLYRAARTSSDAEFKFELVWTVCLFGYFVTSLLRAFVIRPRHCRDNLFLSYITSVHTPFEGGSEVLL
jgi:hypothetical protein